METLTRLPWAAKSSVFKRLEEIADVASLSRQERMKYDEGLRKYRDTLSVLEGAREDGFAEGREAGMKAGREEGMKAGREEGIKKGREEGREEGLRKEKSDTIMRLMAMGTDISIIAAATGLSPEEIKALLAER